MCHIWSDCIIFCRQYISQQNAIDFASEFSLAARAVENSFYVDDGFTGADSDKEAVRLRLELQKLFLRGGFLLRKWNSSSLTALESIEPILRNCEGTHHIADTRENTKTLDLKWNTTMDEFHLTMHDLPPSDMSPNGFLCLT